MSRRKLLERFDDNFMKNVVEPNIENYRKGFAHIKVVDKDGKVVKNAKIKAVQKNHEFKYGANIFMLDELETKEKNELYKKYFKEAFNMATVPFYWSDLEPTEGKPRYDKDSPKIYRRPATDLCIEFCEENGIEPREHGLAYMGWFPQWLYGRNDEEVKKAITKRYKEISERYAEKIPTIEVTNEHWWVRNGTLPEFYFADDSISWCYSEARKYFPNNQLVINEAQGHVWEHTTERNAFYMLLKNELNKGTFIDAIGMQFHMFYTREDEEKRTSLFGFYDPQHLYNVMDRFSEFNLPIQLTEVTIPAYSTEKEDEEIQADLIEKLYSVWFSHKNVEQIVYWNLVDGYAAFAPQGDMTAGENYYHGGLVRFDLTPKPAYYRIKELFQKRWHTEAETTTDESGKTAFKGFYGEYELTLEADGKSITKTISLSSKKNNKFVIEI